MIFINYMKILSYDHDELIFTEFEDLKNLGLIEIGGCKVDSVEYVQSFSDTNFEFYELTLSCTL